MQTTCARVPSAETDDGDSSHTTARPSLLHSGPEGHPMGFAPFRMRSARLARMRAPLPPSCSSPFSSWSLPCSGGGAAIAATSVAASRTSDFVATASGNSAVAPISGATAAARAPSPPLSWWLLQLLLLLALLLLAAPTLLVVPRVVVPERRGRKVVPPFPVLLLGAVAQVPEVEVVPRDASSFLAARIAFHASPLAPPRWRRGVQGLHERPKEGGRGGRRRGGGGRGRRRR